MLLLSSGLILNVLQKSCLDTKSLFKLDSMSWKGNLFKYNNIHLS